MLKPAAILIVEDEDSTRFAVQDYFRSLGHEVDGAADRREAEAKIASRRYALVITDLRLGHRPNREGLEIVTLARERHPGTRVIVLTAFGTPQAEEEARRRGADRFLHKDRPLAEVARAAREVLETKRRGG